MSGAVEIFFHKNKLIISPAHTIRATKYNKVLLVKADNSIEEEFPEKRIYKEVPDVKVAIRLYESNRGVPYVAIVSENKKYETNTLKVDHLKEKLAEFNLNEKIVNELISRIREFFSF